MWWFLIGFFSLVTAVSILVLVVDKEELTDGDPFTVGDATKLGLIFCGGILLGPITTIILIIAGFSALLDSKKVLWTPTKKEET